MLLFVGAIGVGIVPKEYFILQYAFVYLMQPALMRFLVYICLEGFKRGLSLQDILSRGGGASDQERSIVQEREKPLR